MSAPRKISLVDGKTNNCHFFRLLYDVFMLKFKRHSLYKFYCISRVSGSDERNSRRQLMGKLHTLYVWVFYFIFTPVHTKEIKKKEKDNRFFK